MLSRATALAELVVGPEAPFLRVRLSLARCLLDRGRAAEALALLEEIRHQLQPLGMDGATLRPVLDSVQARAAVPR